MLVVWLTIIIFVIVFIIALASRFTSIHESPLKLDRIRKTAVVIGGIKHSEWIEELIKSGYQVIIASRQINRYSDIRVSSSNQELYTSVKWMYCDTRISSTLEDLFQRILSYIPVIDVVINLALIKDTSPLTIIEGERNGDDIHLKLNGAYTRDYIGNMHLYKQGAPGVESWFITNVIGSINLAKISEKYNIKKVLLYTNTSPILKATLDQLATESPNIKVIENRHDFRDLL